MLELGRSGTHGAAKGTMPVLSDGAVVATLHAANWKEAATGEIGSRSWVFSKRGRELTGRWSPRLTLSAAADLSLDSQVFLLWLALVMSRRDQAAATGAVVAGGAAAAGGS